MKLLLLVIVACYIVACIHSTNGNPYAEANPEPLVGTRIKKACKESMGEAKSHKVLCRNIANKVVDKFGKACRKVFKYACTLVTWAVDYDTCFAATTGFACPDNPPEILAIEAGAGNSTTNEAPADEPDHPSWVGRFVVRKCVNHLQPIADKVTETGKKDFNAGAFCKELGAEGKEVCTATLVRLSEDYLPENSTTIKGICKDYAFPWLCK